MTSTTMFTVKPSGPTAPRIAPETEAEIAAPMLQTIASVALTAARSAGVNEDCVYAAQVA